MPILILGAGRSGTSMVARMLGLCGLSMGSQLDASRADKHNPKGYWEHPRIFDLNLRLMTRLCGSFDDPPAPAKGWECDPSLGDLYAEASALVKSEFAGQEWVWKLPQASHTAPFWKRVVPELRFVLCVRNPSDFTSSVEAYPGFGRVTSVAMTKYTRRHAVALWTLHNLAALESTQPAERFVTSYEEYFPDFAAGLAPVLDFIGLPPLQESSQAWREISRFHDPGMRHHTGSVEDLLIDEEIPYVAKELYLQIVAGGRHAQDVPIARLAPIYAPLLRQIVRNEAARALHETGATQGAQMLERIAQLDATQARALRAEQRALHLEQILSSRTHRLAAKACNLLIALRGGRTRSETN